MKIRKKVYLHLPIGLECKDLFLRAFRMEMELFALFHLSDCGSLKTFLKFRKNGTIRKFGTTWKTTLKKFGGPTTINRIQLSDPYFIIGVYLYIKNNY